MIDIMIDVVIDVVIDIVIDVVIDNYYTKIIHQLKFYLDHH